MKKTYIKPTVTSYNVKNNSVICCSGLNLGTALLGFEIEAFQGFEGIWGE